MRPNAHASYQGRLIQLESEPFSNYAADISLARAMYEIEGLGDTALSDHASELHMISEDFKTEVLGKEDKNNNIWPVVVDLALGNRELGQDFLDAYSYMRLNRFLAAEFGPAETASTIALRGIASVVVDRNLLSESPAAVSKFFDLTFPSEILETIFPPRDSYIKDLHPDLKQLLEKVATEGLENRDPALARIVSTLIARGSEAVGILPAKIRSEILRTHVNIFKDKGMSTPGAKLKATDWASKEDEKEEDHKQLTDDTSTEVTEDDDEVVGGVHAGAVLDITKARCHLEKKPGMSRSFHKAMTASIMTSLFPSRGQSTVEGEQMCAPCPIKDDCLEFALTNGIKHGIWGGESERGRRVIRAERRRQNTENEDSETA